MSNVAFSRRSGGIDGRPTREYIPSNRGESLASASSASLFTVLIGCDAGTRDSGDISINIDDCLVFSPRMGDLDHTPIVVSIPFPLSFQQPVRDVEIRIWARKVSEAIDEGLKTEKSTKPTSDNPNPSPGKLAINVVDVPRVQPSRVVRPGPPPSSPKGPTGAGGGGGGGGGGGRGWGDAQAKTINLPAWHRPDVTLPVGPLDRADGSRADFGGVALGEVLLGILAFLTSPVWGPIAAGYVLGRDLASRMEIAARQEAERVRAEQEKAKEKAKEEAAKARRELGEEAEKKKKQQSDSRGDFPDPDDMDDTDGVVGRDEVAEGPGYRDGGTSGDELWRTQPPVGPEPDPDFWSPPDEQGYLSVRANLAAFYAAALLPLRDPNPVPRELRGVVLSAGLEAMKGLDVISGGGGADPTTEGGYSLFDRNFMHIPTKQTEHAVGPGRDQHEEPKTRYPQDADPRRFMRQRIIGSSSVVKTGRIA